MNFKNKKAESLVGIVVGVFILSFVLLGIGNLIGNSKQTISNFNTKMQIDILSKNASKIVNSLNLQGLYNGDIFYIHKNNTSKTFDLYIGEHNNEYKYIDKFGEKIDNPINYDGEIYIRIFQAKKISVNGEEKIAVKGLIKKLIK